jgi:hypothetical protein
MAASIWVWKISGSVTGRRSRFSSPLHVIEGADHSFKVLKRSERTEADVLAEMANAAGDWIRERA